MKHDFGPVLANYTVTCKRCGFTQYLAAPQPAFECLTMDDLRFRGVFIVGELDWLTGLLAEHQMQCEVEWLALESQQLVTSEALVDTLKPASNPTPA